MFLWLTSTPQYRPAQLPLPHTLLDHTICPLGHAVPSIYSLCAQSLLIMALVALQAGAWVRLFHPYPSLASLCDGP